MIVPGISPSAIFITVVHSLISLHLWFSCELNSDLFSRNLSYFSYTFFRPMTGQIHSLMSTHAYPMVARIIAVAFQSTSGSSRQTRWRSCWHSFLSWNTSIYVEVFKSAIYVRLSRAAITHHSGLHHMFQIEWLWDSQIDIQDHFWSLPRVRTEASLDLGTDISFWKVFSGLSFPSEEFLPRNVLSGSTGIDGNREWCGSTWIHGLLRSRWPRPRWKCQIPYYTESGVEPCRRPKADRDLRDIWRRRHVT